MEIILTLKYLPLVTYGLMDILLFACDTSREELKLPILFKEKGEKPGKYQC